MPPADEDARAFMLPPDDDPESQRTSTSPAWTRRSTTYTRSGQSFTNNTPRTFTARLTHNTQKFWRQYMRQWNKLSPLQQLLATIAGLISIVLSVLFVVYNEKIFHALVPLVKRFREITAGWMILWALIFVAAFPPLIGYSTLVTICGFVYGFPNGWFIVATATIAGSTAAFILSRSLLRKPVERLIANDTRFNALSLTLKHDGLKLLIMIRLCPLPYSISNGAIATFPTVHWASFALATACVTPKLLLHVFVGSRLGEIAEKGEQMDAKTKMISYVSILIGVAAGLITGWFMYKKTQARARELEEEERQGVRGASIDDLEREYADDPDALEAAEHLREREDDISLHPGWADDDAVVYHDDVGEDDVANVFNVGDGGDEEVVSPKPK